MSVFCHAIARVMCYDFVTQNNESLEYMNTIQECKLCTIVM